MSHDSLIQQLPWRGRAFVAHGVLLGVSAALVACGSDTTGPRQLTATTAYWALQLNYHAIVLSTVAPFDTIRLRATPVNAAGKPLTGIGSIVYHVGDSTLTVDSTGLVTAIFRTKEANLTRVIATLQDREQNLTAADTAYIEVTDTLPHSGAASLSIQPMPGDLDSAKDAIDDQGYSINQGNQNLPVYAVDSAGDSLCTDWNGCSIPVYFRSSNPTIALIDPTSGVITPSAVGHVTFYASSLVYGTLLSDSLVFDVGHTLYYFLNEISIQDAADAPLHSFTPSTLTIGGGGSVEFTGFLEDKADTVDVTFDDPTALTGTNGDSAQSPIVNSALIMTTWQYVYKGTPYWSGGFAIATFPKRGTFTYHSRRLKASGTIVVAD